MLVDPLVIIAHRGAMQRHSVTPPGRTAIQASRMSIQDTEVPCRFALAHPLMCCIIDDPSEIGLSADQLAEIEMSSRNNVQA